MPHFTASAVTAQPAQNIKASFSINGTLSGSTTVALMPLPALSQITNIQVLRNSDASVGAITVFSRINGITAATYISSADANIARSVNVSGLWPQHSASANLWARLTNIASNAATATQAFQVIASYV